MTKDEKEKVVASWLEMFFELSKRKADEAVEVGNEADFLAWQKSKVLELVEALLSPDFARAERARVARPQVKKAPQVTSEAAKFLKGKLAPKANFGDVMEAARKVIAAVPEDGKVPVDQIPKQNITTVRPESQTVGQL